MEHQDQFLKNFSPHIINITPLHLSGSGRKNYKVATKDDNYIYTKNKDVEENKAFIYLTTLFKNLNGLVPEIIRVNDEKTAYVQEYLGDKTLLELRLRGQDTQDLYKKSVQHLARIQIGAAQIIDQANLYDAKKLDTPLVYRDLFYFKDYFLDFIPIGYRQADLLKEFESITQKIAQANFVYIILRDFQGRNIMVKNNMPYFIDYQDAMYGPLAYDLVSLLWQAKAKLSTEEKNIYYKLYTDELKKLLPNHFNLEKFEQDYQICLILRLLQVLGAYGKLGIIQRKKHFIESIQYGIQNLKAIALHPFMNEFPTLQNIIQQLHPEHVPNLKS